MLPLMVASGFFSGSETALFYLSREELRNMATGTSAERLAATLMRNPDKLLTVVLFWNLVINLSFFAISIVFAKRLVDANYPALAGVLSMVSLVAIIIFGEVAPKSLAVIFRKQVAVWASWPLAIASRILDPLLPFLGASTRGLRRAFWPHLKHEPYLEVDDIERAVDISSLGVELLKLEKDILGRILDISDITAEELMRPRGTYSIVQAPFTREDLFSETSVADYLIVTAEDGDTIIKAIPMRELSHIPNSQIESIAEDVVYIPWCGTVADTLTQLRSKMVSVAAVLNEYGETLGIVTENDIQDTLFNPKSSRTARLLSRDPVVKVANGYRVEGLTTLRFLAERLGFDYDPGEEGVLTVSALLHAELESFPHAGDTCRWEGYIFKVLRTGLHGTTIQVGVTKVSDQNSHNQEQ